MRREPFLQDYRRGYSIDSAAFAPEPGLASQPFARLETGQTLIGVIDGQSQMLPDLRSEAARPRADGPSVPSMLSGNPTTIWVTPRDSIRAAMWLRSRSI